MFDNVLQGIYDKLKPIAEKSRRYSKINKTVLILLVISYIVIPFMFPFIPIFQNLGFNISIVIWALIWAILFLLTIRVLGRKSRKYHLTVDDWSFHN